MEIAKFLEFKKYDLRLAIMVLGDYFECLTSVMDADIERTCEVLLVR